MLTREARPVTWRRLPVTNATRRFDGNDEGRQRLERKHGRALALAFRGALRKVQPARATRADMTPEAAAERLRAAWAPVRAALVAMLTDSVMLGAGDGFAAIGGEVTANVERAALRVDWTTVHSAATDWLFGGGSAQFGDGYASELTRDMLASSERQIAREIAAWTVAGEPLPALTTRLESTVLSRTRAEMIAVTEVTRAYAQGSRLAWEQGGIIKRMRWQTANDELVCPICQPLNQAIAPVDGSGTFEARDGNGMVTQSARMPPAHPRCRCWLSPVADDPIPAPKPVEAPPAPTPKKPRRPRWAPSMTAEAAERWVEGSALADETFYHVTANSDTAQSIMTEGFDLSKKKFGRVWGDGVYVGLDEETAEMYKSWTGAAAQKLTIKVRVKKVFDLHLGERKYMDKREIVMKALNVEEVDAYVMLTSQSLSEVLADAGYDALRVIPDAVESSVGGRQMVVFNPKNVTVIKP